MTFTVQVGRGAGEDVDLTVTGAVDGAASGIIYFPTQERTARLMSIVYSIEADLRLLLYWESISGDHQLLLPLEGRGTLDFSKLGGLTNPRVEGWTGRIGLRGTALSPIPRHFTLALELSKQRS